MTSRHRQQFVVGTARSNAGTAVSPPSRHPQGTELLTWPSSGDWIHTSATWRPHTSRRMVWGSARQVDRCSRTTRSSAGPICARQRRMRRNIHYQRMVSTIWRERRPRKGAAVSCVQLRDNLRELYPVSRPRNDERFPHRSRHCSQQSTHLMRGGRKSR